MAACVGIEIKVCDPHHPQQVEQGPRPERPNERWELDHTLLDVVVIDEEDGLPIGRPTLTAVRDK
jgi:putative transposase